MLHGHSYKPLLNPITRRVWAEDLHLTFRNLEARFGAQESKQAEWIASYLFIFWCLHWLEKQRPAPLKKPSVSKMTGFLIGDLADIATPNIRHLLSVFMKLWGQSVLSVFTHQPLPGVSGQLQRFFTEVSSGRWRLQVLTYVPTSQQVLRWQQRGERCISLLSDIDILAEGFIDQKEPFKFALHDIEHACHFFSDPDFQVSQIGFYQQIERCFPVLKNQSYWSDDNFQKDFNYLISDMNSHPVHLTKTFHAILLKAFKRQKGYFDSYKLSPQEDASFLLFWNSVIGQLNMGPLERDAIEKINLKTFNEKHAIALFDFFSRMAVIRPSPDVEQLHTLQPKCLPCEHPTDLPEELRQKASSPR